ncbi:Phosphatidylcholine-sterol acyltransferase [Tetrabaena socialis]|uniref:Phosphatidylcholine-sterol acyltransferase n=1 Tax=Tetrabaena socialis TaxID=47790 RepID=A0A2J8A2Z3_9CHLO|nr:Phosphatidylcholine-sterol acyltransferase [Tetrabaena socialis]|eukprot:PNH06897.1 Phosphatidylcholine-sterol acyltransferase [Tetrabaena socialis]
MATRRLMTPAEASVGRYVVGGATTGPAAEPPASPRPEEVLAAAASSAALCWVLAQAAVLGGCRRAATRPVAAAEAFMGGAGVGGGRSLHASEQAGPTAAMTPRPSTLVVFGDSLSDTEGAGLSVQNYAYSGATACEGRGLLAVAVPDLMQQVAAFLQSAPASAADTSDGPRGPTPTNPCRAASNGSINSGASDAGVLQPADRLFVLWIGHNDLLNWRDTRVVQRIVANITACRVAALDRLMQGLAAARSAQDNADGGGPATATPAAASRDQILVWPLAFVDFAPAVPEWAKPFVRQAVDAHNAGLQASLEPLRARHPRGPSLQVYDVHATQAPANSMAEAVEAALGAESARCTDPDAHGGATWTEAATAAADPEGGAALAEGAAAAVDTQGGATLAEETAADPEGGATWAEAAAAAAGPQGGATWAEAAAAAADPQGGATWAEAAAAAAGPQGGATWAEAAAAAADPQGGATWAEAAAAAADPQGGATWAEAAAAAADPQGGATWAEAAAAAAGPQGGATWAEAAAAAADTQGCATWAEAAAAAADTQGCARGCHQHAAAAGVQQLQLLPNRTSGGQAAQGLGRQPHRRLAPQGSCAVVPAEAEAVGGTAPRPAAVRRAAAQNQKLGRSSPTTCSTSTSLHASQRAGPPAAMTPRPSTLVVLGDSFSDTGNIYRRTDGAVPEPRDYWRGRFSNGPIWVDHLARLAASGATGPAGTGLSVQNYANGGATACQGRGLSAVVPDLMQQVAAFLQSAPASAADTSDGPRGPAPTNPCRAPHTTSPSATVSHTTTNGSANSGVPVAGVPQPASRLFVVWIGHNDLLLGSQVWGDARMVQHAIANITACRVAALDRLMQGLAAARSTLDDTDGGGPAAATPAAASRDQILVWPLAFVDFAPAVPGWAKPLVRQAVDAHNAGLRASLEPLRARHPQGPSLQVYDVHATVSCTLESAAQLGFRDVSSPCLLERVAADSKVEPMKTALGKEPVHCADPDGHVWGLHASAQAGPAAAMTPRPSTLVVFGDSLSDTGNAFRQTDGAAPESNDYWRGRFSNGPIWVDHVARLAASEATGSAGTGLSVQNYAYGGTAACAAPGLSAVVPDLMQQVAAFLRSAPASAADTSDGPRGPTPTNPCRAPHSPTVTVSRETANGSSANSDVPDAGAPQPPGRLFVVWTGHNDLLRLELQDWADTRLVQRTVANITVCLVAALDRLMQSLIVGAQQQPSNALEDAHGVGRAAPASAIVPATTDAAAAAATKPTTARTAGLAAASRDRIAVWTLAPIDTIPAVPESVKPLVRQAVNAHNAGLQASLEPLRARHPQGPSLQVYDVHAAVSCALESAAQLGFRDVSSPCLLAESQVAANSSIEDVALEAALGAVEAVRCADPDAHVWYDGLHPTSRSHLLGVAQPFAQSAAWRQ